MSVSWSQVRPSFSEIQWPDIGGDQWDRWFEAAWGHLAAAGLTSYKTSLDALRVRMRVFALCWLAHDFCDATFGDGAGGEPYWIDWLDEVGVSRFAILILAVKLETSLQFVQAIEAEDDVSDVPLDEATNVIGDDETKLAGMAAAYVAAAMRPEIVEALKAGSGGTPGLVASMWEAAGDWTNLRQHAEDDLGLTGQELERHVFDEIRLRLFQEPVTGDPEDGERINAWEWVSAGCPVIVAGYPEYGS
jgi:hypothetical protein